MNPNYGKGSGSLNSFDFDLGLGSGKGNRSLNDQKQKTGASHSSSGYSTMQQPKPAGSSWQYGNSKPSWTHQPAPSQSGLNGPTSMVGDITGRSWNSSSSSRGGGIGILSKNPNLFGDLVGSALGQNKSGGTGIANIPLKNAGPVKQEKSAYAMGSVAGSLPKQAGAGNTGMSATSNVKQGSTESFGGYSSAYNNVGKTSGPNTRSPPLRPMGGANGKGGFMSASEDPFGSLFDFGIKQGGGTATGTVKSGAVTDDSFGNFQKAPKGGGLSSAGVKTSVGDDSFGSFQNAAKPSNNMFQSNVFPTNQSTKVSNSNFDDFAMPTQNQHHTYSSGIDPLDVLFPSTSTNTGGATAASGNQQPTEVDWGMDSEINGSHDDGGTTTELEGLPPPPAGVSSSTAKSKGLDNYKQGQFADAIKWLSWAIVLLEKSGDNTAEVLSSRASCYKEVGEYKKAVADCTKVLETDSKNVNVLVQRALLYESIEKYKLGAEDLRAVLKIDPMNRVARSTVHRLTQMAG